VHREVGESKLGLNSERKPVRLTSEDILKAADSMDKRLVKEERLR